MNTASILYIGCEQGMLDNCSNKDQDLRRFIDVTSSVPTLLIISPNQTSISNTSLSCSDCCNSELAFVQRILDNEGCAYQGKNTPSTHAINLAKRLTLENNPPVIELSLGTELAKPIIESISNNIREYAPNEMVVIYLDEYCQHQTLSSTSDQHLMYTRKTLRTWAECMPTSAKLSADIFALFSAFACAKFTQPKRYFSMRYTDTQNLHGFAWRRGH